MKRFVVLLVILCAGFSVMAQNVVSDFQQKYGNGDEFTNINISSKMFQMMASVAEPETEEIVKNLTGMKVLTAEKNMAKYYQDAVAFVSRSGSGYEELMSVQEKNENVRMFTKESKGVITELIIVVGGTKDFVLLELTGKIDLKQMAKLSKSMNINGMEYLNKVK